jgi:signal transduction histidine kinase
MIDEARPDVASRPREESNTLKAQLARAHRWALVGQLAAGIAHEINTPTQYIGDNLRFLRDAFADLRPLLTTCLALLETRGALTDGAGRGTPGGRREAGGGEREAGDGGREATDVEFLLGEIPDAIDQSLEGVARVAEIARSMKDFSHPDNGEMYPVDINRVVESTLTISRSEWKYVAEVTADLDPGLPPAMCVPGEMNQVLLNLIVNAAHAIEARPGSGAAGRKGTIAVRTRQDDGWVRIEVEDNGSGIPEAVRDRVFERFFTTKDAGRGTGQGLAIARGIVVDRHGGTIRFETEVGRGTVFTVRIPIHPELPYGEGDSK